MSDNEIVDLVLGRVAPDRMGGGGWVYNYAVTFKDTGEVLVECHKDPEFAAARELVKRGITGAARFWRHGKSEPDITLPSIERASKFCTIEDKRGCRFGRYRPMPGDLFEKEEVKKAAAAE